MAVGGSTFEERTISIAGASFGILEMERAKVTELTTVQRETLAEGKFGELGLKLQLAK